MGWSKSTWMIACGLAWMVWNVSLWVCPLCTMSVMPVVCQHCSSWLCSSCAIESQTHIPSLVCSESYTSMASFLWTKIISLFFPVLPPCHSGHQHSLRKKWCFQTTCMIDIQTCGLSELGTASHHPISGLGFQWMMKVGIYISMPMGTTFTCCPAEAVDCPTTGIGYPRFLTFPSFAKPATKDNTAWVLLLSSKNWNCLSLSAREWVYDGMRTDALLKSRVQIFTTFVCIGKASTSMTKTPPCMWQTTHRCQPVIVSTRLSLTFSMILFHDLTQQSYTLR